MGLQRKVSFFIIYVVFFFFFLAKIRLSRDL